MSPYKSPLQYKLDDIVKELNEDRKLEAWEIMNRLSLWQLLCVISYSALSEGIPVEHRNWIKETANSMLDLKPAEKD